MVSPPPLSDEITNNRKAVFDCRCNWSNSWTGRAYVSSTLVKRMNCARGSSRRRWVWRVDGTATSPCSAREPGIMRWIHASYPHRFSLDVSRISLGAYSRPFSSSVSLIRQAFNPADYLMIRNASKYSSQFTKPRKLKKNIIIIFW